MDAVISWVFLAFGQTPPDSWSERCSAAVADKISYVLSNFQGIEHADSFAADFHKTGFCPYAAGVFVVKSTEFLAGLPVDGNAPKETLCWGESEINRQTMENSRSSMGIAAIWISLRRLGLSGLREYVLYQMEVCEEIKTKLRSSYSDHFEVLSSPSCGWEIIVKPHFGSKIPWEELQQSSQEIQDEYAQTCQRFLHHLWFGDISEEKPAFPFIGFVKKYSRKGDEEKALPAFLIHPSSLHYDDEAISELLEGCLLAKTSFGASLASRCSDSNDAFLEQLVPPR